MNQTNERIALFCCKNSGYKAFLGIDDPKVLRGIEAVPLPCTGKVEIQLLLKTLEKGYAGVLVLGCPKDNCNFVRGNYRAEKRVDMLHRSLEQAGLSTDRVRIRFLSSVDSHKCIKEIEDMKNVVFQGEGVMS